jgi:hypothetical protein
MTTPDQVAILNLGELDSTIAAVMVTPEMGEILLHWLTTGKSRDEQILAARYVSEKVMEHLVAYVDRLKS